MRLGGNLTKIRTKSLAIQEIFKAQKLNTMQKNSIFNKGSQIEALLTANLLKYQNL